MSEILKKHMPEPFKRVSRMLGYTLLLGGADAWNGLTTVLQAKLTTEQRAALAWSTLRALEPDQAALVAVHVCKFAGTPAPSFFNPMEESRWWATFANRVELKAYCLASFEALSPSDRAAFLAHVRSEVAA